MKMDSAKKPGIQGKRTVESPRVWLAIDHWDGRQLGYFIYRNKSPVAFVADSGLAGLLLAWSIADSRQGRWSVPKHGVVDDLRSLRLYGPLVNVPAYLSSVILLPVLRSGAVRRLAGFDHACFDVCRIKGERGMQCEGRLWKVRWDEPTYMPVGLRRFHEEKSGHSRRPHIAKLDGRRDAKPVTRKAA